MTRCTYRDAQPVNAAAHTLAGLRVRIEQLRHRQACSRQPDNQPQLGSTGAGSEASVANRQHCEKCCAGVDSGAPMMEGGSIAIRRLTGSASQAPPHLVAQPLPALRPPQDAGCCPPLPPQRTAALPRRCHLDKVVAARLASSKSGGASQNHVLAEQPAEPHKVLKRHRVMQCIPRCAHSLCTMVGQKKH